MICWCILAGTSACEHCSHKAKYFPKQQEAISIPYMKYVQFPDDYKLQELENAIKRLNDRIDEILGEEE